MYCSSCSVPCGCYCPCCGRRIRGAYPWVYPQPWVYPRPYPVVPVRPYWDDGYRISRTADSVEGAVDRARELIHS